MFISIKASSSHEGSFRAERNENSGKHFFYTWLRHAFSGNESAHCDTFFRNHEPNRVRELSLSYMQNMPIYYPGFIYHQGNINFQFVFFKSIAT